LEGSYIDETIFQLIYFWKQPYSEMLEWDIDDIENLAIHAEKINQIINVKE
jgi:hypothetical protein